jgi:hypothetical protein
VGYGTLKVSHNTYYGSASAQPAPFDLPQLREWLDEVAAGYQDYLEEYPAELSRGQRKANQRELSGFASLLKDSDNGQAAKDAVRRLIAGGVAEYLILARGARTPLSDRTALDLIVFALWPVVQAPRLPDCWQNELAEITSPRLVAVVAEARRIRDRLTCETFTRAVADKPFSRALLALLQDLADPGRGGPAVTALALTCRLPEPPVSKGPRAMLAWFLAGVAVGTATSADAVNEAVAELLTPIWSWVNGQTVEFPSDDPDHTSPLLGKNSHGVLGSVLPQRHEAGPLGNAIDDIIDSFN